MTYTQRHRHTQTHTQTQRDEHGVSQRYRHIYRHTQRHTETLRDTQWEFSGNSVKTLGERGLLSRGQFSSYQDGIGTQMLRRAFHNQESEVRGRGSGVKGQNRGHKLIKPRKKLKK